VHALRRLEHVAGVRHVHALDVGASQHGRCELARQLSGPTTRTFSTGEV
jgi:hypothetical protein